MGVKQLYAIGKHNTKRGVGSLLANIRQLFRPTILQDSFTDMAVMVDVSSWQPVVDFQALKDAGVDAVAIRAFHPTNYTEGYAQYVVDKYYYERVQAAKKIKGLLVIAYGVPGFVMDINDHLNMPETKRIMDMAWGPEQYRPHVIAIDAEINYFYRGSTKITVPAVNISAFFMGATGMIWNKYRRPPMFYTRVTWMEEATRFVNSSGNVDYYLRIALDNANGSQETIPLWLAFYPNVFNVNFPFTHVDEILSKIPAITPVNRKYLEFGASKYYAWQLGAKFLHDAVKDTLGRHVGFDVNVLRHGAREMWEYWGYEYPEPGEEPGPGPDPEPNPTPELLARVAALELAVTTIHNTIKEAGAILAK